MFDWIKENSSTLNVAANYGMLAVWLVYLQLFLMSYRRQRKAKIIVNRGVGAGIDAHCLISNMSAEPIYMQSILTTVRAGAEEWTAAVASVEEKEDEGASEPPGRRTGRQGPLLAGGFVDLGPFEKLMHQAAGRALGNAEHLPDINSVESVEVLVIGIYGSEDLLVGARRRFEVVEEGVARRLRPKSISTEQLGGRRNRKLLERLMRDTYIR